ncbi:uncharacterized protein [Pyrus communis]|uniref:uncharacterized protein n=1 Tax=Pyrus communis TaxID=23211 RepID=UPI0035C1E453
MVTNISCLNKNLDLRLMLCTKIVTAFADDEMQSIRDVISLAIQDSNVKGGLRWPLGKAFSGGRYKVVVIWHTITTTYENPSLKLKLRHANRFDFTTSAGETGWEVRLFLQMLISKLQEENVEVGLISDMLQENMKLIWDDFLCCEPFPT